MKVVIEGVDEGSSNQYKCGGGNIDLNSVNRFLEISNILPLSAQYIYSLLMFVINNRNLFLDNAELYTIKTRDSYNLHPPLSHLTKYQKRV